ncbi:MAG: molybdenum cofactor biosynthesis protein B [Candidatus Eutrophobiaceae bacterium]
MMSERRFIPLKIALLTISDTRTEADDTSGQLLAERFSDAGHELAARDWVSDDIYLIRAIISAWIADPNVDAVISTGGTGVTGRDSAPEAFSALFDKVLQGFGELFRHISFNSIGTSCMQSRAVAGVANGTFLFVLPGSRHACITAWDEIIQHQLDFRTHPCNLVELIHRLKES